MNMNLPQVYTCSPSWTPLPPPSPSYPSGSSQCTSPKHPVSCIEPGLAIHFLYDIIHVLIPFSQIIPPSPSPTESKRLFCTSVSLLLSRIQGCRYHFSKFHIYVLVYCIGVFLSGLLHSVYYHIRNASPVQVRCRIQEAWAWYTGMTQRDGMGREGGRGFRMGNMCTPVADSCWCMAKPIQYCKVISLQWK